MPDQRHSSNVSRYATGVLLGDGSTVRPPDTVELIAAREITSERGYVAVTIAEERTRTTATVDAQRDPDSPRAARPDEISRFVGSSPTGPMPLLSRSG